MTVDPTALSSLHAPRDASASDPNRPHNAAEAARQFEALILRQMMKVMRSSSPSGILEDNATNESYMEMFDDAITNEMAEAGGIGLAEALSQEFGVTNEQELHGRPQTIRTLHSSRSLPLPTGTHAPMTTGSPLEGATGRLQRAASEVLHTSPMRWGRNGRLAPDDLGGERPAQSPGQTARFVVNDANGYQGYYKCNLFAFEVARRAGFDVPLSMRVRGLGYPASNAVANDAGDRELRGEWARVATGESAASLDSGIQSGRRAFLLAGSAAVEDRRGHMAVVERVHDVDFNGDGTVRRIVFDGWEARHDGARHLVQRTWNVVGNAGGHDARNGFDNIEILELNQSTGETGPQSPGPAEAPLPGLAKSSSSLHTDDPKVGAEEQT